MPIEITKLLAPVSAPVEVDHVNIHRQSWRGRSWRAERGAAMIAVPRVARRGVGIRVLYRQNFPPSGRKTAGPATMVRCTPPSHGHPCYVLAMNQCEMPMRN